MWPDLVKQMNEIADEIRKILEEIWPKEKICEVQKFHAWCENKEIPGFCSPIMAYSRGPPDNSIYGLCIPVVYYLTKTS
jgi:hypothetical protein